MKRAYRIAVVMVLISLSAGTGFVGCQLKRLNDTIENIRSEIPMSVLGN